MTWAGGVVGVDGVSRTSTVSAGAEAGSLDSMTSASTIVSSAAGALLRVRGAGDCVASVMAVSLAT